MCLLPCPHPTPQRCLQKIGEKMGDIDPSLLGGQGGPQGMAPPAPPPEVNNILDAAK